MKKASLSDIYSSYLKHPNLVKDTREISAGCFFIALKGENFDANEFAEEALNKGASYALIDNPSKQKDERFLLVDDTLVALQELAKHHRKELSIPILGITGSNGKTSTKELVASVMKQEKNTFATAGNYNNHIGVPLSILSIQKSHEFAIIEMGANHQGEIAFLSDIADPDFGIITNIGKAHLEGFGGLEGVKKGKSELYKHLKKKNGFVFLNGDDETLLELAEGIEQETYGLNNGVTCLGTIEQLQPNIRGNWTESGVRGNIDSSLYGKYNFYNILAAVCVASHFGLSKESIEKGISNYSAKNNRSERIQYNGAMVYLDAYNANPSSMELALNQFSQNESKAKLVILGDMFEVGETEAEEHEKVIQQCEDLKFSEVYFVGKRFSQHQNKHQQFSFCDSSEEIKKQLQTKDLSDYEILIKGSRGMALEKILS